MELRQGMEHKILRIVWVFLFLLALLAVFTAWSQVGGQYHLDIMAWYWKLALGFGMAYAVVRATAAAVTSERAWNRRTLRWLGILLALGILAGVVTYYYHIYEPSDEQDDQEQVTPAHQAGQAGSHSDFCLRHSFFSGPIMLSPKLAAAGRWIT